MKYERIEHVAAQSQPQVTNLQLLVQKCAEDLSENRQILILA